MPRFYCPALLSPGGILSLPEVVAHHVHVLRLQAGAEVTLFNGDGHEYRASIVQLGKRQVDVHVVGQQQAARELPYPIALAQALPEGSKMDWIVEKAVELGVHAILPVASERCVVRLAGDRAEKRRQHWEAVVIAASEQCGRNTLATVAPVTSFDKVLEQAARPLILLSPRASTSLPDWARDHTPQPVSFLIGPEGGFSPREEAAALAGGAELLSLGPRVLRTETAALAAISVLNSHWGGFATP